jgi:dihydroxy-acid dehydratase
VLIGGCDKTVPALLMAAASVDIPAIVVVTGPMITSTHRGQRLGACTDCRRFWAEHRAGKVDAEEMEAISGRLAPGPGTCMVMGTASTMALATEAMGMMLPGGASIPAVHADRLRHAEASGTAAVRLAADGPRPTEVMTERSMRNALRVVQAVGGSTNALVHLAAVAGRLGFDLDYDDVDRLGVETPVVVDLKPSGEHYMEHLFDAGGLTTVLRTIEGAIDRDCLTVTGRTLGENLDAEPASWPQQVVRPLDAPAHSGGAIRVLGGNLAPQGAVIKQAAATPALLRHRGRAVVFSSLADMAARIDDPDLDVRADDVLVLQNAGPKGAPGMPEAGYIPIPKKLAAHGVRDMVRLSDARMSGTAFGAVVLHISPEAAVGGPLALVRDGDMIVLDVEARRLEVEVSDEEMARRRSAWQAPVFAAERGYERLHHGQVLQAEDGCDFDFLRKHPRGSGTL